MQPSSVANLVSRILLAFPLASAFLPAPAHAQTFTVLHTFRGAPNDGEGPLGIVIRDSAGDLYGTTGSGGTGKFGSGGTCGTGFMLNKVGKEVAHLDFKLAQGCAPMAGLLRDAEGNFFGTTVLGGNTNCFEYGCGTVYKVSKTGKGVVLHKFTGSPDGEEPEALLVEDSSGNLYGTTFLGGTFENAGTVFELDSEGNETILYNFCSEPNCADGYSPYAGVIRDPAGNLYGAAAGGGGHNAGVVYELDPNGKETVLYSFTGLSDGSDPFSVLVFDPQGNLYGTTQHGGNLACGGVDGGCGVVFELSPQPDGSWKETTLYTFCSLPNCTDGQDPLNGPLLRDTAGNLYGTTYFGGKTSGFCKSGCGVVFKLDTTGKETILHTFTGGSDGANPWAGLTIDSKGNLYGTTVAGGDDSCFAPDGCGVVFQITP
jgi:uncharacterized repeat protein (TIGR03803 family)